jgi:dihydrofolate reductase
MKQYTGGHIIYLIAAISQNGILGVDNTIPWKHKEDMQRFKKLTTSSTVIMGRKTFESIGKPLPNRNNIVVSKNAYEGTQQASSLKEAIELSTFYSCPKTYLIGGASIYEEGMEYAEEIDLTIVPEVIDASQYKEVAKFPWINPTKWFIRTMHQTNQLMHIQYVKI